MILYFHFKTPDVVDEAMEQYFDRPEEEMDIEESQDYDKAKELCDKFFSYGENVTIKMDTEKGTVEVVPKGR